MRSHHLGWFLVLAVGCGGGGDGPGSSAIDDYDESPGTAEDMSQWAGTASAAAVFAQSITPLFVASFVQQTGGTCPVIVETETTTTYDGGCTDDNGNEWFGHAEAVASATATGTGNITYDGFGFTGDVDGCPGLRATTTWDGAVVQSGSATSISFSVDLLVAVSGADADSGCVELNETLAFDYSGTMANAADGSTETFSGSGRIGSSSQGVVSATTDDEVIDENTCSNEAMSGTTTITASGHTAVVTYDGATDCDPESTVTWTYDGADQGELTGISCGVAGGSAGPVSLLLVAGALLGARRRRVRR